MIAKPSVGLAILIAVLIILAGGGKVDAHNNTHFSWSCSVSSSGNPSPQPAAVGQEISADLTASSSTPSTHHENQVISGPTWGWSVTKVESRASQTGQWADVTSGYNIVFEGTDPASPSATLKATFQSAAYWRVTVQATVLFWDNRGNDWSGTGTKSLEMTAVGVEKLQYHNGDQYADVGGTIYVVKETQVQFKAIKVPADASWPSGKPVWTGASGSGDEATLNASSPSSSLYNPTVVSAECGPNPPTVNVIICELDPTKTPSDNFLGRSQERFGVGESLSLGFTTDPAGVTAAQLGGLKWTQILPASGSGSLSAPGFDGTGAYTCPSSVDGAGGTNTTLKLEVVAGPSKGKSENLAFSTVKPSQSRFYKVADYHEQGWASVGFWADIYLEPTDVSFANCIWAEDPPPAGQLWPAGAAPTIMNGWYGEKYPDPDADPGPHQPGPPSPVGPGDASSGCYVEQDECRAMAEGSEPPPPWYDGNGGWNIRHCYKVNGDTDFIEYQSVVQRWTIDENGAMTMTKGDASAGPYEVNDFSAP